MLESRTGNREFIWSGLIPLEIISHGWIVNKVYSYRPNSFHCHCSTNLEVLELGGRSKVIYMMLVQKKYSFTLHIYWFLCTVKPVYSGHCVVRSLLGQLVNPQTYYLKGVMNFQFLKSVIYVKSDRFLAVLYLMPACQFYRYRVLGHSMRFSY